MRALQASPLILAALLALTGCASPDRVLFVTKTSLGIDFDAKPASASIAYDRIEGYTAPRYANGEIPPVVASLKSDGGIFNPHIRQLYATGDAAEIVISGEPAPRRPKRLQGEKALMFFGTSTTTGLKLTFTTGLPDSLSFGYKRKEFSYIPLATVGTGNAARDVYPSILASIDTQATAGSEQDTGLRNVQFFATGHAARLLAANPGVRQGFENEAAASMQASQLARVAAFTASSQQKDSLMADIRTGFGQLKHADDKAAVLKFASSIATGTAVDGEVFLAPDSFDDDLVDFAKFTDQTAVLDQLARLKTEITRRLTSN
jgi:hypothetical protein